MAYPPNFNPYNVGRPGLTIKHAITQEQAQIRQQRTQQRLELMMQERIARRSTHNNELKYRDWAHMARMNPQAMKNQTTEIIARRAYHYNPSDAVARARVSGNLTAGATKREDGAVQVDFPFVW